MLSSIIKVYCLLQTNTKQSNYTKQNNFNLFHQQESTARGLGRESTGKLDSEPTELVHAATPAKGLPARAPRQPHRPQ